MSSSWKEGGEAPPASVISGGSGKSTRVPLSARSSLTSVVSIHPSSYAYLNDRVYNPLDAKSEWLRRVRNELKGKESERNLLKRLPADFDPFLVKQVNSERVHSEAAQDIDGDFRSVGCALRVIYSVFSSRAWDRLYLFLGLLWSVLCPGHLDGAIESVEREHLALVLLMMFVLVVTPIVSTVLFKAFFSSELRPCLRNSGKSAGVFFLLATKVVPVPAIRIPDKYGKRVYPDESPGSDAYEIEAPRTSLYPEQREPPTSIKLSLARVLGCGKRRDSGIMSEESDGTAYVGANPPVNCMLAKMEMQEKQIMSRSKDGASSTEADPELPPRHWRCIVCKKVNILPTDWDGRASKAVQVIIKRKLVDVQAMHGIFRTKQDAPPCNTCHTPFNYVWRHGRADRTPQRFRREDLKQSQQAATSQGSAGSEATSLATIGTSSTGDAGAENPAPVNPLRVSLRNQISKLIERSRQEWKQAEDEDSSGKELWYGRRFRRDLDTYFKDEVARPSLSTSGGRYPVGSKVACFAGKQAWYPGTVEVSRENSTYDVRYDDGDIAQHVFSHMIRFAPTRWDSKLVFFYWSLALAAAVMWPLVGFLYFSRGKNAQDDSEGGLWVAAPALVLGIAGVVAVAAQFWVIYRKNRRAGLCITARYAAIIALPPASLAFTGGMAAAKASAVSTNSWVEMLLLPASLFSLKGGGYAYAVSPAYGRAWAISSVPWLLFLLLVSLRLDAAAGDASPIFGRMRWLVIFFPLWVLLSLLFMGHHVLPLVWEIEGNPEPAKVPSYVSRTVARVCVNVWTGITMVRSAICRIDKAEAVHGTQEGEQEQR